MTGMHHTPSIAVPASGTVALEPGGFHVMLEGLSARPRRRRDGTGRADLRARPGRSPSTPRCGPGSAMSGHPPRPPPAPLDRRAALVGGALLAVIAAVAIGLLGSRSGAGMIRRGQRQPIATWRRTRRLAARPGLELVDQDGEPFALTSLAGHPVLVFFGYTHCPDVCPATSACSTRCWPTRVRTSGRCSCRSIPERDGPPEMAYYLGSSPRRTPASPARPRRSPPRGGMGREVREDRRGDRRRLRDGPHRGRVPRRCRGQPAGAVPVRDGGRTIAAEVTGLSRSTVAAPSAVSSPTPARDACRPRRRDGPRRRLRRARSVSSSIWAGARTRSSSRSPSPTGTPLDGSPAVPPG